MNYIDGFVAAVPVANKEAYLKHAAEMAVVLKEYGALRSVECWGDDVPEGKVTSFSMAEKRAVAHGLARQVDAQQVNAPQIGHRHQARQGVLQDPAVNPRRQVKPLSRR